MCTNTKNLFNGPLTLTACFLYCKERDKEREKKDVEKIKKAEVTVVKSDRKHK